MAKHILETQTISLITNKIYYLILSLGSTEHQLVKYSLGQCDVIKYITRARGASEFIQLNENLQYQVLLEYINPLNPELNPICYLLALLAHHFLHVSRIRVKSLTLRLLMSYIYIWCTYS